MYVIETVAGLLLVTWGARRLVAGYQRWRRENRRPGYIVAWHVDESKNGYPRYYTYEMRRAERRRRRT